MWYVSGLHARCQIPANTQSPSVPVVDTGAMRTTRSGLRSAAMGRTLGSLVRGPTTFGPGAPEGAVETVHSASSHQLWNSAYFLDLPDITTHRSLSCLIKSPPYRGWMSKARGDIRSVHTHRAP